MRIGIVVIYILRKRASVDAPFKVPNRFTCTTRSLATLVLYEQ